MLIHPLLVPILKLIYPIKEPNRTRDRPLEVLAVGLSRSGTDSLRQALKQLGYNECHHATLVLSQDIGEDPQWVRLGWRKYHTDPSLSLVERGLDASEFDKCIGNCMALTDMYCASFAPELIRAYPDAKVIINKRDDVQAWYQSVTNAFENPKAPSAFSLWRTALFDPELFWIKLGRDAVWSHMVGYNFIRNGKQAYQKHYQQIDDVLEQEKKAGKERNVLRWHVEDGWTPLTEFLGRKIPTNDQGKLMEFPNGNTPTDLQSKRLAISVGKVQRANRRMRVALILVTGTAVGGGLWWWKIR